MKGKLRGRMPLLESIDVVKQDDFYTEDEMMETAEEVFKAAEDYEDLKDEEIVENLLKENEIETEMLPEEIIPVFESKGLFESKLKKFTEAELPAEDKEFLKSLFGGEHGNEMKELTPEEKTKVGEIFDKVRVKPNE